MSSPRSTSRSPSSAVSSGGIAATQIQHPQTQPKNDSPTFLSNEMLRLQLDEQQDATREHVYSGSNIDNEHQTAIQPTNSSSDSTSSSFFPSASPLSSLAKNYSPSPSANSHLGQNNNHVYPRSRMRERSAPLPSAPPCTPASIVTRQTSFSQTYRPIDSPSALRNVSSTTCMSNVFHSPLTESDVETIEQDSGGESDSNSVEIISGANSKPFCGRSTKMSSSNLRSMAFSAQQTDRSNAPSPSSSLLNHRHAVSTLLASHDPVSSSASQTPTPHPLNLSNVSSVGNVPMHADQHHSRISSSNNEGCAHPGELDSSARSSPSSGEEILLEPSLSAKTPPENEENGKEDDGLKTPNIYINGLPPNFPDESLYLMCRDYGKVLSVRTFTRCVGEKMSGYGFVLFSSVEGAEQCIEALKKFRNLHPSFSKQIHKIPGTQYASGTITLPPVGSLSSLASQPSLSTLSSFPSMASTLVSSASSPSVNKHISISNSRIMPDSLSTKIGPDYKELNFREKMERLADNNSTNLYMEGLPLTVDETSLSALVSPHKILSSRFFQTKLSNPPRMIAFVRLDTRPGAEEIIERIHGRVVRGWNDNGCRISVRFADTNEQRELRRVERRNHGMDDEESDGSQISMAHAALLNLRGAEAQLCGMKSSLSHHGLGQLGIRKPDDVRARGSRVIEGNYGLSPSHSENSMLLSNVPFHGLSTFGTDGYGLNKLDSNELALLQHQTQMQQLQLLQQMQGNTAAMDWHGLDPHNYGSHDTRAYNQAHNLMPSADIMSMSNDVYPFDSLLHITQASAQAIGHGRKPQGSKSSGRISSYNKSPIGMAGADHYEGRHGEGNFVSHHHPLAGSDHTSHASVYSPGPLRAGAEQNERMQMSGHRRANTFEEGEVSAISPALTYASRTPSTLSPATPLFNTFNTPASVPATVPRSKPSVRERDFARLYKNDFRQ